MSKFLSNVSKLLFIGVSLSCVGLNTKNKDAFKLLTNEVCIERKKQIVVTFLGLSGHMSCFAEIHDNLAKSNFSFLEASPSGWGEYNSCTQPCAKLDAFCMDKTKIHLGLGDLEQQAIVADSKLGSQISDAQVILCGHSQGAIIAIEFWKLFRHKYDIKGVICIAAPLKGITMMESLASHAKLQNLIEESESSACSSCLSCFIPGCIMPIFKACGACCCRGIIQLAKDSQLLLAQHQNVYKAMAESELPFLNIIAECHETAIPEEFSKLHLIGPITMKNIIAGGRYEKSDNLLAVKDQRMPITAKWPGVFEVKVEADHGMFDVEKGIIEDEKEEDTREERIFFRYSKKGTMYYYRTFSHPTVIAHVLQFCNACFKH